MSTSKHIFVVDDDLAVLLRMLLEGKGHQVSVCEEIEGAVEAICVEPPDLVILDLFFHGRLLGLDTYHALRANAMTADLPIIITTASIGEAEMMRRRLQERPRPDMKTQVVPKPFDVDDLLTTIEALIDG